MLKKATYKTRKEKVSNAAELLIECLETEGIRYIFGVPGEENLTFLEALRKSKIKMVVTRNEQSAAFMAANLGRFTGKAGVALSTLGPGATNFMTGAAYAQLGAMPLLLITGQKPIRESKQGKFQIIDVVRMMEPVTKFSGSIISAGKIGSMVREAISTAEAERPGAVHLELPEDIALEETAVRPITPQKVSRPNPEKQSIEKAISLIESARSPLVVIASGGSRTSLKKELGQFLNKTHIPFITTQLGKGVIDEHSSLYLGTTALSRGDYVHKIMERSDLLIMVGHDTKEKPPIVFSKTPAKIPKILHINFLKADIDRVYSPDYEVVGDIGNAFRELAKKVHPQKSWNFSHFYRIRKAFAASLQKNERSKDFPLRPERIVYEVNEAMPEDGIISLDNGMYKIWFARNYRVRERNSLLLDNTLATMGAGLSAGIAAKLIYPEKKVLVIAGDGGIMMNIAELETAKRLGLHLVILILNDSGFGMIKWKQKDMKLPNFGLEFSNPDFVKLAESFGGTGYRVTSADSLSEIVQETLGKKGIHIIDCPTSYAKTNDALGKNLQAKLNDIN